MIATATPYGAKTRSGGSCKRLGNINTVVVIFMATKAQARERMTGGIVKQRRISSTEGAAKHIYNKDMI